LIRPWNCEIAWPTHWRYFSSGHESLSEKVFLANKGFAVEITAEESTAFFEVRMIRETGWSLEYIRGLPIGEQMKWSSIFKGEDGARGGKS